MFSELFSILTLVGVGITLGLEFYKEYRRKKTEKSSNQRDQGRFNIESLQALPVILKGIIDIMKIPEFENPKEFIKAVNEFAEKWKKIQS